MYQVIAVDLDGTLLTPNHKLTKYTKKIIKLLFFQGFYFILASGRHYIDIINIQNSLQIKTFIASSNGARVYDLNNQLIFQNNLNSIIASKLCKIRYSDPEIITQVYCDDQWYINNNKVDNKFCPALSSLAYEYFYLDSLDYSNVSKIFFTSYNLKKLSILQKYILYNWKDKVNATFSVPGCLEVVSGSVSKGKALHLIANTLNISIKDFIAFGDGMNDEDMLSIVGKGCIMQNGDKDLKTALPNIEIIGNNEKEGVAFFLYNMFIKNNEIF